MAFQKGNKLGGRTPGAVGKVTSKVREAFTQLVENNLDQMQKDLDSLEPKDRVKLVIDLANFTIPKLKSIEVQADINAENNNELLNKLLAIPEANFNKLENDR